MPHPFLKNRPDPFGTPCTYSQKMARKGRTKVIYKGTFVSEQSLLHIYLSAEIKDDKIQLNQSIENPG